MTRPGISDATLQKAEVKFSDYPEPGSIEIPYFDAIGKPTGFSRWRLPRIQPNGKKYHQEPKSGVHVYFPPGGLHPSNRLILTEGEFKSLSLHESGYQTIGLAGLYTYKNNPQAGTAELLPEIQIAVAKTEAKEILFLGDSDTATNLDFSRSAHFLAATLTPLVVRLPRLAVNGPKGIDDLKESRNGAFAQELEAIFAAALPVAPKVSFVALAEVLLCLAEKQFPLLGAVEFQVQIDRLVKLVGKAKTSGESPLAIDRLESVAAKLAGATKSKFSKTVDDYLSKQQQSARSQQPKTGGAGPNAQLVKVYGAPVVYGGDKADPTITQINEPFWAAHYSKRKEKIIYEPREREFYEYGGSSVGIYVPISQDTIRAEVAEALLEAARTWPGHNGLEQFRNQRELAGVLTHLRGIVEDRDFFESTKYVVHLGNCTLKFDLTKAEFTREAFSSDHHSRNRSPIDYDPAATCPEFKKLMLDHIKPDDRELLQKFAGQCLLGRNIMQRFLILDGVGGASKGSFVLTIDGIIGQKNVYELRTRMLQERFEIGRMLGRTLLVGSDVRGDFLSHPGAHRIKSLVGGDPLEGEMKGSNQRFTIYGVFNLMITSNTRLHIRLEGDRSAWERRLSIVRYDKPYQGQRIAEVEKYLISRESSGILNWCIEGLQKLLEDYNATGDILMSKEQKERVDTLLSESDSLRLFVRDHIIRTQPQANGDRDSLTTEEIIAEYIEDCVTIKHWVPIPMEYAERQLPNLVVEFFGLAKSHDLTRGQRTKRGYWNVRFS
jgi:P4 family phage/plasmid primase-like protien